MINKEFLTWFKEQECYPFTQGWMLKQSLYGGGVAGKYAGRKTVKQKLDEKQNINKSFHDWIIDEWHKKNKSVMYNNSPKYKYSGKMILWTRTKI